MLNANALQAALRERQRYPSRSMIVRPNGGIYWPQPREVALPGEVLLAPYNHDGPSWGVSELHAALQRAAV